MTELKLFETLKASYEDSTPSHNRFAEALDAQEWDATFYADGEHYFCKGEMVGLKTLDQICKLLDMQPGNIIKYVDDKP